MAVAGPRSRRWVPPPIRASIASVAPERVIRNASPFDSAKPSRSSQNRGLSRYGWPAVGQNGVQLPHSLQASPTFRIWTPCSTTSEAESRATSFPPWTTNDGSWRERRGIG